MYQKLKQIYYTLFTTSNAIIDYLYEDVYILFSMSALYTNLNLKQWSKNRND